MVKNRDEVIEKKSLTLTIVVFKLGLCVEIVQKKKSLTLTIVVFKF